MNRRHDIDALRALAFLLVIAYAFWPTRARRFEEAARMPLRED